MRPHPVPQRPAGFGQAGIAIALVLWQLSAVVGLVGMFFSSSPTRITAIGGLFVPASTLKAMPTVIQLVLGQPLILGTVPLVVLKLAFSLRRD